MKLITELNEEVEYIAESNGDEKSHYIKGIFLQSSIKNRNGRMYPEHVMDKEVGRYLKEVVEAKRAMGELGHPQGPQINLDRVSHIITELTKDGKNYIGKAKLTDTPFGNTAKGLIKSGVKLGVSSRGLGSLKPNKEGIMEVQDDFRLATAADIVADPSAPDAFVEGIMENVDWVYDPVKGTWLEQRLDEIKKDVRRMTMSELEQKQLAIFENYMNSLASKTRIL